MLVASFKLEISGLSDLQARYSSQKIESSLLEAIGKTTIQLHNLLNSEVRGRYATNRSLNSILTSPIGQRSFKFVGGKLLEGSLEYRQESNTLGELTQKHAFYGNLREPKPRKGWVQQVKVLRKSKLKSVRGQKGFGGFKVKVPGVTRFERFMLERSQKATWIGRGKGATRAPTHILWGLSLADMAEATFNKSRKVQTFVNTFGDRVVKELIL